MIDIKLKVQIMETIKAAVDSSSDKVIIFRGSDNTILAELKYTTFNPVSTTNPAGKYQFYSSNPDTKQLRGKVITGGVVTSFEIPGVVDVVVVPKLIYGKVGGISSNADMKFSSTTWVTGKIIKINSLTFSIGG